MSVVVLAYHEMGCTGLETLLRLGVDVSAVFTYEDKPGENIWFRSVADLAREAGIETFLTESINDAQWVERIRKLAPEVVFSFYYRHMLGKCIRSIPSKACVNLHGSLLPKFRGRCPVNWQLVNGETLSGVTLHHIVREADAGDIVGQEKVTVGPDDRAIDLYRKLLPPAARVLKHHVAGLLDGTAPRIPQDHAAASVFGGRTPEDGRIDWSRPAREIHDLVRAVAPPWPGAFSDGPKGRTMVFRTRVPAPPPEASIPAPGTLQVGEAGVFAGTGSGWLELVEYEVPGGAPSRTGDSI